MTTFADFYIKQGDVLPSIRATLVDDGGALLPLANATVKFNMRRSNGSVVVSAPAAIDDVPAARVSYAWQPEDTAEAGLFEAEWEITYGDQQLTAPNYKSLLIQIIRQVG